MRMVSFNDGKTIAYLHEHFDEYVWRVEIERNPESKNFKVKGILGDVMSLIRLIAYKPENIDDVHVFILDDDEYQEFQSLVITSGENPHEDYKRRVKTFIKSKLDKELLEAI